MQKLRDAMQGTIDRVGRRWWRGERTLLLFGGTQFGGRRKKRGMLLGLEKKKEILFKKNTAIKTDLVAPEMHSKFLMHCSVAKKRKIEKARALEGLQLVTFRWIGRRHWHSWLCSLKDHDVVVFLKRTIRWWIDAQWNVRKTEMIV